MKTKLLLDSCDAKNNHLVTSLLLGSGFWSDYLSSMSTGAMRGLPKCGRSFKVGLSNWICSMCSYLGPYINQSTVCKAQVNEVVVEKSSNSTSIPQIKLEVPSSDSKDVEPAIEPSLTNVSIFAFTTEVASLVKCFQTTEQAVVVHQPSKSHTQILRCDFVLFVEPNVV